MHPLHPLLREILKAVAVAAAGVVITVLANGKDKPPSVPPRTPPPL